MILFVCDVVPVLKPERLQEVMENVKPILQVMTERCIQIEQYQANVRYLEDLHARFSARHRKLQDEYREGESLV